MAVYALTFREAEGFKRDGDHGDYTCAEQIILSFQICYQLGSVCRSYFFFFFLVQLLIFHASSLAYVSDNAAIWDI